MQLDLTPQLVQQAHVEPAPKTGQRAEGLEALRVGGPRRIDHAGLEVLGGHQRTRQP